MFYCPHVDFPKSMEFCVDLHPFVFAGCIVNRKRLCLSWNVIGCLWAVFTHYPSQKSVKTLS
jgi:hypothetical protein